MRAAAKIIARKVYDLKKIKMPVGDLFFDPFDRAAESVRFCFDNRFTA